MDSALESFLSRDLNLPSIPAVAHQLLALAGSPDSNSKDLADVLLHDPAIASTVLRHVNSPVYAQAEKIVSIQRAVVTLGFDAVTNLALMFSLVDSRPSRQAGLDLPRLWQRCLLCAIAAKVIGREARETQLESLFLAGLLQDIGMLALDRANPSFYEGVEHRQFGHRQITELEIKSFKVDHAQFGAWMLKKWRLPAQITSAIARSHGPIENSVHSRFECCVVLAGLLADLILDDSEPPPRHELEAQLKEFLQLERRGFEAILQQVQDEQSALSWVYDKLIAGSNEAYRMRVQAQRLLNQSAGTKGAGPAQYRELQQSAFLQDIDCELDILPQATFEKQYSEVLAASRGGSPHLALVRVDNLRAITSEYGEALAEQFLRVVGSQLSKTVRATDLVTRYGDIFAVALLDTEEEGARFAVHRLLQYFRDQFLPASEGRRVKLQLSAGIAISVPRRESELENSMNVALEALQKAGNYEIVSYIIEAGPDYLL